jgi:AcrR family transcriptional regulator
MRGPMSSIDASTGARWQRRKTARPGEILSAALASFAEHGFAATRLDDVAARAGVTKGTLYLYFPNKQELFKAVVRQELVPNIERAEAVAADLRTPSLALLEKLVGLFAGVVASPLGAIPKLVLTEAGNFPDLARFYRDEVVDRGKALFRRVIERGVAAGEFRPVDAESTALCVAAPLLLAALWRFSFERHTGRAVDVDGLCRTQLDLLRHGLLREPSPGRCREPGLR